MLYDISPPIGADLAVWPGDTPPSREVLMEIARGHSVTLSTLRATVHLGAHADAPSHYLADGSAIDTRDLDLYLGPCRVVTARADDSGLVCPEAIAVGLDVPRIVIRTGSFPDPNRFSEDFAALAPELIDRLASEGVLLVGIDTPSVDPFFSKTLDSHHALARHDMAVLEGLVLEGVPDGLYELIALPLRLVGFDASPVRAVLRTIEPAASRGPGS